MCRRRRLTLAALLALCTVAAVASVAQGPPPPEIFLDRVEVDVVNLEVVVTDRRGNPVRGLTRDDFVVYQDGERVELSNFYAIEEGARKSPAASEAIAPPADPDGVAETAEPLPEEQRLSLAVVIDNANIEPASRKRVLEQLHETIDVALRPGDRVLVASLEPGVELRQGFTQDLLAVDAALEAIGRSGVGRSDLLAQRRMIERQIARLDGSSPPPPESDRPMPESPDRPEDGADRMRQLIESYAGQSEAVLRQTFASLSTLTSSLAGLPGRRAVLLVSEHLTTNSAQNLFEGWADRFQGLVPGLDPNALARRFDVTEAMRQVARQAAADRVTFYTLHASGGLSGTRGAGDGTHLGAAGASGDLASAEPLMHLAAATGGSSMLNSANAAALLEQMNADYRDYYSLGFSSAKSQDGRYHRIEVKVPGSEARVRHTEGYRAKTPEQRMSERTLSALMFDLADNPLDVRVQLMPEQADGRHLVLPVLVRVPIAQLVLVPQENEHVARLSIVVALRDAEGRLSDPQRVEVPISIPNDNLLEAMGQEVGHGINLRVRRGAAKLAVGVRDELSTVESTLNLNVSIGKG